MGIDTSISEALGSIQISDDDHSLPRKKADSACELKVQTGKWRYIWESCLTSLEIEQAPLHFPSFKYCSKEKEEHFTYSECRGAALNILGKWRVVCLADPLMQKRIAVSGCSG